MRYVAIGAGIAAFVVIWILVASAVADTLRRRRLRRASQEHPIVGDGPWSVPARWPDARYPHSRANRRAG